MKNVHHLRLATWWRAPTAPPGLVLQFHNLNVIASWFNLTPPKLKKKNQNVIKTCSEVAARQTPGASASLAALLQLCECVWACCHFLIWFAQMPPRRLCCFINIPDAAALSLPPPRTWRYSRGGGERSGRVSGCRHVRCASTCFSSWAAADALMVGVSKACHEIIIRVHVSACHCPSSSRRPRLSVSERRRVCEECVGETDRCPRTSCRLEPVDPGLRPLSFSLQRLNDDLVLFFPPLLGLSLTRRGRSAITPSRATSSLRLFSYPEQRGDLTA